jgi:hypothetical protein
VTPSTKPPRFVPLAVKLGEVWVVTAVGMHLMYAVNPCLADVGEPGFRKPSGVAA